jgi:hypothetical protein
VERLTIELLVNSPTEEERADLSQDDGHLREVYRRERRVGVLRLFGAFACFSILEIAIFAAPAPSGQTPGGIRWLAEILSIIMLAGLPRWKSPGAQFEYQRLLRDECFICGGRRSSTKPLLLGAWGAICPNCIGSCARILHLDPDRLSLSSESHSETSSQKQAAGLERELHYLAKSRPVAALFWACLRVMLPILWLISTVFCLGMTRPWIYAWALVFGVLTITDRPLAFWAMPFEQGFEQWQLDRGPQ